MERESIGPYRVVDKLGAGGMGEVFLAFDTRLNRNVALKSLSDPALDAPRARARLLREARAAAHITHANIAAIYDILEAGAHAWIVMEYAEGEPLSKLVSRGPVPCPDVLEIAVQIADAMAHAHAGGIIHRDLKPANIVLTPERAVKILDFGLARTSEAQEETADADLQVTRDLTESRVSQIAGTPAYMAPEQLVGAPASALSDIYSLGATLYELLAGRRPFDAPSRGALAWDIVSKPTPIVSAVAASVPASLAAIVAKAMAKAPADRYQSAAEMADELRRVRDECRQGSQAGPSPDMVSSNGTGRVSTWSRARGVALGVGAIAVVALLLPVFVQYRRQAPPPDGSAQFVAVLPFASSSGDPAAAIEAAGFAEAVAATLEGLSSVTVLSQRAAQSLAPTGDVRRDVLAAGVTRTVSGAIAGPPGLRALSVRVEDAAGNVLFSRRYDQRSSAVAIMRAEALRDIVTGLSVALTSADRRRLEHAPACRPETYEEIARARGLLAREDIGGNPALAESTFRAAAARDPSCAHAYAGLSDASWARYGVEHLATLAVAASEAIVTASTLDPDSPTIRMSLARVYLNTGRSPQAEQTVRQVIERRPADDEPHRLLSFILDDQHRGEEAAGELARAIKLRPTNAINYLLLGNRHYNAQRYEEALTAYRKVLEIQPDNEYAIGNSFAAHVMTGDFQQAIEVYQRARVKDATMRSNLGSIYVWLNRCAEAADLLRDAVASAPRDDVKRRNLGDAYACLGRPADALREYRTAVSITGDLLKVNPEDAPVLARHAVYEAKCGLAREALEHIEDAQRRSPTDGEVLYRAAVVYSLSNQPTKAVERLRQAIDRRYSRALARVDSDLAAIRQLPGVAEMLK